MLKENKKLLKLLVEKEKEIKKNGFQRTLIYYQDLYDILNNKDILDTLKWYIENDDFFEKLCSGEFIVYEDILIAIEQKIEEDN
jgi:hypothetical protein